MGAGGGNARVERRGQHETEGRGQCEPREDGTEMGGHKFWGSRKRRAGAPGGIRSVAAAGAAAQGARLAQ